MMAELWDILDKNGSKTGRLHERGKPLGPDDYFLFVHVWILNDQGKFLLSKRAAEPIDKWHITGGAAIAGDDSLTAALREAKEEIGIDLYPDSAQLYKRITKASDIGGHNFSDIWLFRQQVDISKVILQPEEISDVMWADCEQIKQIIAQGDFAEPEKWYPYINEFLEQIAPENNTKPEGVGR